jgi:hypothetical protein
MGSINFELIEETNHIESHLGSVPLGIVRLSALAMTAQIEGRLA